MLRLNLMSALGSKQTFAARRLKVRSADEAAIETFVWNVCYAARSRHVHGHQNVASVIRNSEPREVRRAKGLVIWQTKTMRKKFVSKRQSNQSWIAALCVSSTSVGLGITLIQCASIAENSDVR